jgi:enoyl-CoA hydratase
MPADQLHLAGLINRLVPAGEALDAARDLAVQISKNAPLALVATKRVIVESLDWPASEAFARQGLIAGPVFGSADAIEGARAFGEKRPPVWRGE